MNKWIHHDITTHIVEVFIEENEKLLISQAEPIEKMESRSRAMACFCKYQCFIGHTFIFFWTHWRIISKQFNFSFRFSFSHSKKHEQFEHEVKF